MSSIIMQIKSYVFKKNTVIQKVYMFNRPFLPRFYFVTMLYNQTTRLSFLFVCHIAMHDRVIRSIPHSSRALISSYPVRGAYSSTQSKLIHFEIY